MVDMSTEFKSIFGRLRKVLQRHSGNLFVTDDSSDRYSLAANIGSTALQAWKGKAKRPTMPVAWVEIKKSYVSFHLMGLYGNQTLRQAMSKELKARLHGKTCFNFKTANEKLFQELEQVTTRSIDAFRNAGYIAEAGAGTGKSKKG